MRISGASTFRRACRFALVLALLAAPASSMALMVIPHVFTDNMVLQREKPIPVWGKADPGEEVTVTLSDKSVTVKADDAGRWLVRLPAMPAGGPYTLTIKGKNATSFKNVMVGEVWICSGQSNMAWTVKSSDNAEKEIAVADHPDIRLFTVRSRTAPWPADDVETSGWQVCSPQTVGDFSGVGYYYGRELNSKLKVPVGLINTSWGGTLIEPWTPPIGFARTPKVSDFVDKIDQADRDYVKALSAYLDSRLAYLKKASQMSAEEAGKNQPAPAAPNHPFITGNRFPCVIYNSMISPLLPYGIAGAIWYQGESNCMQGDKLLYTEKMRALIDGWRTVWMQGAFPFYYVQIAPWEYGKRLPGEADRLPMTWQAQLEALSIPNTGMAVIHDVGNLTDIHPTNKQEVGRRLALWALAKTYGQKDLVYSGPLYKSMAVEGGKIRVTFDHVGSGLASRDSKPLSWFQVAGEDKKFVDATATIDGDTILVSSDRVAKPAAVRLGWSELAEPNLMNKEGLPASPFRTDPW